VCEIGIRQFKRTFQIGVLCKRLFKNIEIRKHSCPLCFRLWVCKQHVLSVVVQQTTFWHGARVKYHVKFLSAIIVLSIIAQGCSASRAVPQLSDNPTDAEKQYIKGLSLFVLCIAVNE
jgi:hypothetical protein